jgi:hypothetical protein
MMPTDADRQAVLAERQRQRLLRGGLGLYTYRQIRYETPFQLIVGIVVGLFVASIGAGILWSVRQSRLEEIADYGSAGSHFGGWFVGSAVVLIGVFYAHAGIIILLEKNQGPQWLKPY